MSKICAAQERELFIGTTKEQLELSKLIIGRNH